MKKHNFHSIEPQADTLLGIRIVGAWQVDLDKGQLNKDGRTISLDPLLVSLLSYFLSNPGQLLSKDQLIEQVWAGRIVSDEAVMTAVSRLRKTLEDDPNQPAYIQTLARRGYQWIAPFQTIDAVAKKTIKWPAFIKIIFISIFALAILLLFQFWKSPVIDRPVRFYFEQKSYLASLNKADLAAYGLYLTLIQYLQHRTDIELRLDDDPLGALTRIKSNEQDKILSLEITKLSSHSEKAPLHQVKFNLQSLSEKVSSESGIFSTNKLAEASEQQRLIQDFFGLHYPIENTTSYIPPNDAYEAYIKGRYLWQQRNPQLLRDAVNHYQQAIELAPDYLDARIALVESLLHKSGYYLGLDSHEALNLAQQHLSQLADTSSHIGEVAYLKAIIALFFQGDAYQTIRLLESHPLLLRQRPEALPILAKALSLTEWYAQAIDRLSPLLTQAKMTPTLLWDAAFISLVSGQHQLAKDYLLSANQFSLQANDWFAGLIWQLSGDHPQAKQAWLDLFANRYANVAEFIQLREKAETLESANFYRALLLMAEDQNQIEYRAIYLTCLSALSGDLAKTEKYRAQTMQSDDPYRWWTTALLKQILIVDQSNP